MKNNNLHAFVATTGVRVVPDEETAGAKGCTLANATTYYFPVTADALGRELLSLHLKWAAAVAAVFTLEVSNLPGNDASDYDATAGNWQQYNPSTAYVPVSGASNSATAATVTAGGAAAGSAVFELSDVSSARVRIKAVVTTGGLVRVAANGKGAVR